MRLSILARELEGELEGPDGEKEVTGVSTIEEAGPGQVCYYGNPIYAQYLEKTGALAVISRDRISTSAPNTILVKHPYMAFRKALLLFRNVTETGFREIHPTSVIHPDASISEGVTVGPGAVIDRLCSIGQGTSIGAGSYIGPGTTVGPDCTIFPGVHIYHDCRIGSRVTLHSGSVIGSDGFGFVPDPGGHLKVPQNGNVIVHDDVEIGAGCTIDRAVIGSTVIGRFSKLDNLVHIAHNVVIGEGCLIAAQTGIAGSTRVGSGVTFGGQAGIAGHISIGDGAVIAAQAGVMKSVPSGTTVSGYPARPHERSKRISAAMVDLPEFRRKTMEFIRQQRNKEEDIK